VCAPKLFQKEARHLWKVEISAAAEEYISKVEISGPTPNKEKQVVVVFIPKLHCFVHSKFFGFCICSPQNQAPHHFPSTSTFPSFLYILMLLLSDYDQHLTFSTIANMPMIWDSAADAKVWLSSIFNDG
jgi:hypothetical protein